MHIASLYQSEKPVLSFEVFPPKKDGDIESVYRTLQQLTGLSPGFISVTYGAGGAGNVNKTCEIASLIKNKLGVEALAHLTCIAATKERIRELLEELKRENIDNILAMRGDLPADRSLPLSTDYRYASDLIRDIAGQNGFCIGAACYPEGHIDCDSLELSVEHLLQKQQAGASFGISQLFFDNTLFYRFLDLARAKGITLPISAGVMPILSRSSVERMIFLCGASLPSQIIKLLHRYEDSPADLRKAGIEHAVGQMEDLLAQKVDGVHIYTMNQADIAATAMERIGG